MVARFLAEKTTFSLLAVQRLLLEDIPDIFARCRDRGGTVADEIFAGCTLSAQRFGTDGSRPWSGSRRASRPSARSGELLSAASCVEEVAVSGTREERATTDRADGTESHRSLDLSRHPLTRPSAWKEGPFPGDPLFLADKPSCLSKFLPDLDGLASQADSPSNPTPRSNASRHPLPSRRFRGRS